MKEPEVSLLVAIEYIKNGKTRKDITVSIDGAHIKIKDTMLFDITSFMKKYGYTKFDNTNCWQGEYHNSLFSQRIIVTSKPGIGDVIITLNDGKVLYIESKKFKSGSGGEYPAMREAIGQLMTGCPDDVNSIPVVAVPYNNKSVELSKKWSCYKRIRNAGIRFMLVHTNGCIEFI